MTRSPEISISSYQSPLPSTPGGKALIESTGRIAPPASETVNSRPRRRTTSVSPRILTIPPSSTLASWLLVIPSAAFAGGVPFWADPCAVTITGPGAGALAAGGDGAGAGGDGIGTGSYMTG